MMAWFQLCAKMGLMAATVLSISLTMAEDFGRPPLEGVKRGGPVEIVKKETHPVLSRQKRDWIWTSLDVEEEKPAPTPYKIGRLKSSKIVEVKRFEIEGEGANTIFTVDSKGDLYVTRSLDREEKNSYILTARMFDGNNKLVEDYGDFVVAVTDINDNSPVFPRTYNAVIMERATVGTPVVQVRAVDADDPTTANGELRYSLTDDLSTFQIDSITGMISCKTNTLDRERQSQYVVVVKAQDMRGMASGLTATTSVTITIIDINDNIASFTRRVYDFQVLENHKLNEKIGMLELEDRDEIYNKEPIFTIPSENSGVFGIELTPSKDGNLLLKQALDFETTSSYTFTVQVHEDLRELRAPADNHETAVTTAQVNIRVLVVDEPPVFTESNYTFTVPEEQLVNDIGTVTARDPDRANNSIRYSISDKDCPISINPLTGQLSTLRMLDRELEATHMFQVRAQEEPSGLESFVKVNIIVEDVNDNKPELAVDELSVCVNNHTDTVLGTLTATDRDEQPASFSFSLAPESSNFTIRDYGNSTADIMLKQGPFSLDDPKDYSVDVHISDGGQPLQTSITKLSIKLRVC